MQRWLVAAVIVAGVVAAGAGFVYYRDMSAIRDVEVIVTGARLSDDYLAEIFRNASLTVTIHMQLYNPSGRDISDMGTDFDVDIGSTHVGTGGFSGVDVDAHGRANRTMNVTLSLVNVTAGLLDAIKEKQFSITLDGRVSGDVLYGLMTFRQSFTASYAFP